MRGCSPISKTSSNVMYGGSEGCGHDSSKDRPAPIVPLCGTGLPASQWGQVLPALWPRPRFAAPWPPRTSSTNTETPIREPNILHTRQLGRGCQRDGAGRAQPSGGLGVQPPAKEPPVGGGPVGLGGGRSAKRATAFFTTPQRGV